MDFTKKTELPHTEKKVTVPASEQMQGFKGPQDKWDGEVVDMNYSVVPTEKEAIQANLKKAAEEIQQLYGLDQRGVEPSE